MELAEIPRHRFTVEEYHRMGDVGLLHRDTRVELIDGENIDNVHRAVHRPVVGRSDAVRRSSRSRGG